MAGLSAFSVWRRVRNGYVCRRDGYGFAKKNPGICLEMVSPFDAQAEKWETEYKKRHDFLFANADIVTMTGHEYTKSAMFVRNRYLVNNADLVLAAYDGQPGGTAMTINYAKKMGVRVCIIRPVAEKN
jgi:uncharacterized phage-like protein YoqJ